MDDGSGSAAPAGIGTGTGTTGTTGNPSLPDDLGRPESDDPLNYGRSAKRSAQLDIDPVSREYMPYSSGGMTPKTYEFVHAQRGVAWEFIKRIGRNILESKDIRYVSLPVKNIFEPRSYLQRACDHLAFANTLLSQASDAENPIERLKWVTTFVLSGLQYTVIVRKPFNPILGETWQARMSGGQKLYCEQTSHHPPITHWLFEGPKGGYMYTGQSEWKGLIRGNSIKGVSEGEKRIDFADGGSILIEFPALWLRGIMWGDRYCEYLGDFTVIDEKNKLKSVIRFNPQGAGWLTGFFSSSPPSDYINGDIHSMDAPEIPLAKCEGSWIGRVLWDGQVYWDRVRDGREAEFPEDIDDPLPSDVRFRGDLQALAEDDIERAEELKVVLEEKQRYDRKLRRKGRGEGNPAPDEPAGE